MLRVVGRLDNIRPAPGAQGQLKKIKRENGFYTYMREDESSFYAFPMSKRSLPLYNCSNATANSMVGWKIHYDGDIPGTQEGLHESAARKMPGRWQN
jgi:linoleate 10R-lipoxygenase